MTFGDSPFGIVAFAEEPDFAFLFHGEAELGIDFFYRLCVATREFVTVPTDTPARQRFFGAFEDLRFTRSLLGGSGFARFVQGNGELSITNADGEFDTLPQIYGLDGRRVVLRLGRLADLYRLRPIIFEGTAADMHVDAEALRVNLQDNGYKLEVPLQTSLYAGTGGAEGGDDLKEKPKPKAYGYVYNVSPPLVVPSLLIYQVHDGSLQAVSAVYDKGIALTPGADYASYALLAAAVTAAGTYDTCLAEGYFRLGATPDGTVTADIEGDNADGFKQTTAEIVRRILATCSVFTAATDLYLPSFTAFDTAQPAAVGYWAGHDATPDVATALADILEGVDGWIGFRRSGRLEIGIMAAPTGAPQAIFEEEDIRTIRREKLPSAYSPPPWRHRVGYQQNETIQTDLADGASATRRAFAAERHRLAAASNNAIKRDHPFAADPEPIAATFIAAGAAQAEASRRLALYSATRSLYRWTANLLPLSLNIGAVVQVTYPRFDLTVGRLLRIVEITDNARSCESEIVGYG